jgi:hypothetical protein
MDVVPLSYGECGLYLHQPQELKVHLHPTGSEHTLEKIVGVDQGL